MSAISLLLLGLTIVLCGIVVLRLHAFIALFSAALFIGLLTSETAILDHAIRRDAARVASHTVVGGAVQLQVSRAMSVPDPPSRLHVYRHDVSIGELIRIGDVVAIGTNDSTQKSGTVLRVTGNETNVQPGDFLISSNDDEQAFAEATQSIGTRLASGFGDTCRKIGLLIAFAAIIGQCLMASGAARRIVSTAEHCVGAARAPLAFVTSGFILGIPIFFDTVFFLLLPLARTLYRTTRANYLLYVMSVVIGATMAHSLVPPTPGPLLVSGELGVDLFTAILAGLIVGSGSVLSGYAYILWANRHWSIQPDTQLEPDIDSTDAASEVAPDMPPFAVSILPIALPILLLAIGSWTQAHGSDTTSEFWRKASSLVGDKNIALALSAALSIGILYRSRQGHPSTVQSSVQIALASAGTVILITAAGGTLGHVIRQTNIAGELQQWLPSGGSGMGLLVLAFAMTTVFRVAQGSATVAMITAVGIVGPLAAAVAPPYHPVYLYLAIGCGSKPLPWMNDSGFWVVSRMSGMTVGESLRTFSATLTVMGFVGFAITLLGACILPMEN